MSPEVAGPIRPSPIHAGAPQRRFAAVGVIDKQIEAYNAHDIEGFLACYAPDAVIEDGRSNVLMRGIEGIRAEYEPFFP